MAAAPGEVRVLAEEAEADPNPHFSEGDGLWGFLALHELSSLYFGTSTVVFL